MKGDILYFLFMCGTGLAFRHVFNLSAGLAAFLDLFWRTLPDVTVSATNVVPSGEGLGLRLAATITSLVMRLEAMQHALQTGCTCRVRSVERELLQHNK